MTDDAKVRVFLDDAKNAVVQAQEQLDKGNGANAILATKKAAATLIAVIKALKVQRESPVDESGLSDFALLDQIAQDHTLADMIIERLNALLKDEAVREDIAKLLEARMRCSTATADHPTIQVSTVYRTDGNHPMLGFLGLLNGIVGALPEGKHKGMGYIAAHFDDKYRLTHFCRTDQS